MPDGGSGGGSSSGFVLFDYHYTFLFNGQKPLAEYADKYSGAQGLWNLGVANNNTETAGVITADGKFIAVAILGSSGGSWEGLYHQPSVSLSDYYT